MRVKGKLNIELKTIEEDALRAAAQRALGGLQIESDDEVLLAFNFVYDFKNIAQLTQS